ncbi:hypothetical protein IMSAGC013_00738 [Lachnospiraceae bacterium]|nr:hypothetical protein IMSAGC013_00738 [Lachnospiraceae bacterium]
MGRLIENIICRSPLANSSAVHNENLIAHACNYTQIMGYHNNCHSKFFLQILHQFQNLRLNRNVQGRSGFICNQNIRLADQCHGNHYTLTHTAGQFVGILFHPALRFIYPNQCQHLYGAFPGLFLIFIRVKQNCFHQLASNRKHRIQAGHRVLENNGAFLTAEFLHLSAAPFGNVVSMELHFSGGNFTGFCQDLHNGIRRYRLTGTGFSHNSQGFSRL